LATVGGNAPYALARMAEALPLTRALGDSELLEWALQTEGRVWLLARDPTRAAASTEEALRLARWQEANQIPLRQPRNWSQIPALLGNLGGAVLMSGDAHRAVALHEE